MNDEQRNESEVHNSKRKRNQEEVQVVMRNKQQPRPRNEPIGLHDDRFNSDKRNSLKHISVNGLAAIIRNKFEQNGAGANEHNQQQHGKNQRPKSVVGSQFSAADTRALIGYSNGKNVRADFARKEFVPASLCYLCKESVSIMERQNVLHLVVHANCFRCGECSRRLDAASYEHLLDPKNHRCKWNVHFFLLFLSFFFLAT